MSADGQLTSAGREVRAAVEDATDRAASRAWERPGADTTDAVARVLTPLALACASVLPGTSPTGAPRPAA